MTVFNIFEGVHEEVELLLLVQLSSLGLCRLVSLVDFIRWRILLFITVVLVNLLKLLVLAVNKSFLLLEIALQVLILNLQLFVVVNQQLGVWLVLGHLLVFWNLSLDISLI